MKKGYILLEEISKYNERVVKVAVFVRKIKILSTPSFFLPTSCNHRRNLIPFPVDPGSFPMKYNIFTEKPLDFSFRLC